jgi:5-methylcytosine-specific restriction enzyme subunit McrC
MIVLREHESIRVGAAWCSQSRTLGQRELDGLLSHQEKVNCQLLKPGFKNLTATSWVGTLGLGRYCLDVIPKIDNAGATLDERQTRTSFLWMAARAGVVPIAEADVAPLAASPRSLLVAFLQLYVQKLFLEWTRGPVRQYVAEEENHPFLKGKLLFAPHLRHNAILQHRFFTRTDDFVVDNPLACLLKAALRRCAAQSLCSDTALQAKRLLLEFADVADTEFSSEKAEAVILTRQHQRFEKLVGLAKMILRSSSPGGTGQCAPIYSLMFDMNIVFERFVAAELQAALAGTELVVRSQLGGRSLLLHNGRPKFQLRPDLGVFTGKRLVCLLDTKWKRLDPHKNHFGISQADMYQMYAYGKEFDAPVTFLLYPQWGNLPQRVSSYLHPDEQCRIEVVTVTLGGANGSQMSAGALREQLKALVNLRAEEQVPAV